MFYSSFVKYIKHFGEILFISLLVSLVKKEGANISSKEEDVEHLVNKILEELLKRFTKEKKRKLFANCIEWLREEKKMKVVCSAFAGLRQFVNNDFYLDHEFDRNLKAIFGKIAQVFKQTQLELIAYRKEMKSQESLKENLKGSEWNTFLQ